MKIYSAKNLILLIGLTWALFVHGGAWADEHVRTMFDVRTPMADGVELSSNIWLPEKPGKYPLILIQTPYLKNQLSLSDEAYFFAQRGYAVAVQDLRGKGDSDGQGGPFYSLTQDGKDLYDTIAWMAEQPWSNGEACMIGLSYLGLVQLYAARLSPPALKCIIPATPANGSSEIVGYWGGAFRLKTMTDYFFVNHGRVSQPRDTPGVDWNSAYKHRPLIDIDKALGKDLPRVREWIAHPELSYWRGKSYLLDEEYKKINVPALHVTGWFDINVDLTISNYVGMRDQSASSDHQYLLVGPWDHGGTFWTSSQTPIGEMPFNANYTMDMRNLHLGYLNHYLKGEPLNLPRVRIYMTGVNDWRSYDSYPVPGVKATRYYLSAVKAANSVSGDGALVRSPGGRQIEDKFTYDPHNPVPEERAYGDKMSHGYDRNEVQRRADILVYTSDVLDEPLPIIGPVYVELFAKTDARDTDFTATITDVQPDGRALMLGGSGPVGIIRARYRNDREEGELLQPGKIEKYQIKLGEIGHVFQPGHRIRVEISSSAFPLYDRNPNTGNEIATDTAPMVPARQTIYHDRKRPSALVLPVATQFQ